jgi:hypothetical protein
LPDKKNILQFFNHPSPKFLPNITINIPNMSQSHNISSSQTSAKFTTSPNANDTIQHLAFHLEDQSEIKPAYREVLFDLFKNQESRGVFNANSPFDKALSNLFRSGRGADLLPQLPLKMHYSLDYAASFEKDKPFDLMKATDSLNFIFGADRLKDIAFNIHFTHKNPLTGTAKVIVRDPERLIDKAAAKYHTFTDSITPYLVEEYAASPEDQPVFPPLKPEQIQGFIDFIKKLADHPDEFDKTLTLTLSFNGSEVYIGKLTAQEALLAWHRYVELFFSQTNSIRYSH